MRAQPMPVALRVAAMQYSCLPVEVEVAGHVWCRCAMLRGGFASSCLKGLDCLLHEGFHVDH